MQKEIKPNKRKEGLIKFSREHHYGLLLVWKIRQGIKSKIAPARIADFILFFFRNDLQNHFKAEESVLFPKLDKDDPLLKRVLQEHQTIYTLINDIQSNDQDQRLLNEFADTLEKHIRFEERELFNHLQTKLSDEELRSFESGHDSKPEDVSQKWPDKFWEFKKS